MGKITLSVEIDVPESEKLTDGELRQTIFDEFINFAAAQHLSVALDQMYDGFIPDVIEYHKKWNAILKSAEFKILVNLSDTERLEWFLVGYGKERAAKLIGGENHGYSVCDCADGLTFMSRGCKTWREAIDVAMKFPKKK